MLVLRWQEVALGRVEAGTGKAGQLRRWRFGFVEAADAGETATMSVREPTATYRFRVSEAPHDPEWDEFLATTPGGHHVQSSLWGQVKATTGWRVLRIVFTDGTWRTVGGAQMLIRQLPLKRSIAYVPKGPLVASNDPDLRTLIIKEVLRQAREAHVDHLTIQPPNVGPDITGALSAAGFRLSDGEVAPTASVQVDLTADEDAMLARMKKNHRRYIRFGLRQGVVGRRGGRDDLETFHRLLRMTAQRQGFAPYPFSYFAQVWDIMDPGGHIALFLAEYEGEAVSAQVAIGFGDTVITKNSGWTGKHARLGPNHVLEWTTMRWAKSAGYQIYDLEGIDAAAGRILASGGSLPEAMRQRPFFWKLGFGGEVKLFPSAYVSVANPVLRKAYFSLYPRAASWPATRNLVSRLRTG